MIREIRDGDWGNIVALEAAAYTTLSEEPAALRSRCTPTTSFVLETEDQLVGYLLALPYPLFRYPDLRQPEQTRFASANLHLHDLVIAANWRGRGLATELIRHLAIAAKDEKYERISLVAVGDSDTFWSERGFHAHPEIALPASYGPRAAYMSMTI